MINNTLYLMSMAELNRVARTVTYPKYYRRTALDELNRREEHFFRKHRTYGNHKVNNYVANL
jgi:hypothetical protein